MITSRSKDRFSFFCLFHAMIVATRRRLAVAPSFVAACCCFSWLFFPFATAADRVLVANTRGTNNVVAFDLETLEFSEFIPESAGLISPDLFVLHEDDGALYISHGDDVNNSAIFKMFMEDDGTVIMDPMFASGGGMKRPYGFDFYQGTLYWQVFVLIRFSWTMP
jgi:outer membrane protein assembly factor BamB